MSWQLLEKPQWRRLGRPWWGDREEKQSTGWRFSELKILVNLSFHFGDLECHQLFTQLLICDSWDPGLNSYTVSHTLLIEGKHYYCVQRWYKKFSQLLIYLQNIGLNITFVQCQGCVCLCSLCKACSGERREEVSMVTVLIPNPFFLQRKPHPQQSPAAQLLSWLTQISE